MNQPNQPEPPRQSLIDAIIEITSERLALLYELAGQIRSAEDIAVEVRALYEKTTK